MHLSKKPSFYIYCGQIGWSAFTELRLIMKRYLIYRTKR